MEGGLAACATVTCLRHRVILLCVCSIQHHMRRLLWWWLLLLLMNGEAREVF